MMILNYQIHNITHYAVGLALIAQIHLYVLAQHTA